MARYWEANIDGVGCEANNFLKDIINENVKEAVRYLWENEKPIIYIEDDNLDKIEILGYANPDDPRDVLFVDDSLYDLIRKWGRPYGDMVNISSSQKEDCRDRASQLFKFADHVTKLAVEAYERGNEQTNTR